MQIASDHKMGAIAGVPAHGLYWDGAGAHREGVVELIRVLVVASGPISLIASFLSPFEVSGVRSERPRCRARVPA